MRGWAIFIELSKFTKKETGLSGDLDRWVYVLKHMDRMDKLPVYLRKPVFEKLFNPDYALGIVVACPPEILRDRLETFGKA